jgi:type II secretory pathway pseudopilin PulG
MNITATSRVHGAAAGRCLQRGISLLEVILGLTVLAMVTVSLGELADRFSEDTRNTIVASQVRSFGEAARSYIKDNYAAVQAVASATTPAIIELPTLIAAQKLPAGYQNANAFGQSTCALVFEPSANRLQAMVVTEGGTGVGDPSLGQIAALVGGSGGGVYSSDTAKIQGAAGGWSLAASGFDNRANNLGRKCDGSPGNVRVTAGHPVMALWFENGDTSSAFLARDAVPGRPELNAMDTPLVMNSVQTPGAACGTRGALAQDGGGRLLSCQAGQWKLAGDGQCLATSADLNTLQEDGRCYNGVGLPNSPAGGDWVFVEVFRHTNPGIYFLTQRVIGMTGASIGKSWTRSQNSGGPAGGWTSWVQTADPNVSIGLGTGSIRAAGNVQAGSTVTGNVAVNSNGTMAAVGNIESAAGVYGKLLYSFGDLQSNGNATNFGGRTNNVGDDWGYLAYASGWSANAEPQSGRGSAYLNDVYLRSLGKWASQLGASGQTRVGLNGLTFVSNGGYSWLTVTTSNKYAPQDGSHTAWSDYAVYVNGIFIDQVHDEVNVGKFGASGHYWAYESYGVRQRQWNRLVPAGALVQVVLAGANLLIASDVRVDLSP